MRVSAELLNRPVARHALTHGVIRRVGSQRRRLEKAEPEDARGSGARRVDTQPLGPCRSVVKQDRAVRFDDDPFAARSAHRCSLNCLRSHGRSRIAWVIARRTQYAGCHATVSARRLSRTCQQHPNLRPTDAELIVATIFDQITAALARGERVELRGFGAFTVTQRNARIGRNPRTGETVAGGREGGAVLQDRQGNAPPAQWRQPARVRASDVTAAAWASASPDAAAAASSRR